MNNESIETRICIICGEEVSRPSGKFASPPERTTCGRACAAKTGKGIQKKGRRAKGKIDVAGYWAVPLHQLTPQERLWVGDPGNSFVLEHRLIMMRVLKRPLLPGEIIRHINGDKRDNRIANLALGSYRDNTRDHQDAIIESNRWRALFLAVWGLYVSKIPENKEKT